MTFNKNFLTETDEQKIIEAIRKAENKTSGEIRVHIEKQNDDQPLERARAVFNSLSMHETELQNGILIYIAYETKKVAIIGDKGIHNLVGDEFWNAEKDILIHYFKQEQYVDGICIVIEHIGTKLKAFFPYNTDDKDELSNEISTK